MPFITRDSQDRITGVFARAQYDGQEKVTGDAPEIIAFLGKTAASVDRETGFLDLRSIPESTRGEFLAADSLEAMKAALTKILRLEAVSG